MKLQMKPHRLPGVLITFCGLDGCGKTTQIGLLRSFLEEMDISVCLTKQPTDAVRQSEIFRTYMDRPGHDEYDYRALSLLCASDRVQHSNRVIAPLLEDGNAVISDRYFYSCPANLYARGYTDDRWIYEISGFVPEPDLAFFLDVSVDTAVRRVRSRPDERGRYIDLGLQYRLREQYLRIARANGGVVIDAGESIERCFERVKAAVIGVMHYV